MSKGKSNGTTTIELEDTDAVEAVTDAVVEAVAEIVEEALDDPSPEPAAAEPDPGPETLSRYASPSEATRQWLGKRLRERLQEIEGGIWDDGGVSWNGVKVVTAADLLNVFSLVLPEPSAFSSEARSGGLLTVWTHCPNCGIANPLRVDVGAQLTITDEQERKLKPTFKVEAKTHVCGQLVAPLRTEPPVEGQTEAFPEGESDAGEPSPEMALAIAIGGLLDQVADILPIEASVVFPDDDAIAGWTPEQQERVAAWARAVIAGEGPYPEQPPEVTPVADPDPAADEPADEPADA